MGQYLTNIGKVDTSGASTISNVSITNSAGWVVAVSNTGGVYSLANTAGWVVSVANTGGLITVLNSSQFLVSVINTATLINIANTSTVIAVSNTGGSYTLLGGTGVIGTANIISQGGYLAAQQSGTWSLNVINSSGWVASILNTAGWVVNVANTGGAYTLLNGTATIGTMTTIEAGGRINLINTSGIVVSVLNTIGLVVSVANTGGSYSLLNGTGTIGTMNTVSLGSTLVILGNSAGWTVNVANTGGVYSLANTSGLRVYNTIETMQMSSSGLPTVPKSVSVECSATNNLIVAASAGNVIRVLSYKLMAGVANQARFQSGSNSTEFLTGTMFYGASGGEVVSFNPIGWFQVTAGSPLYLKLATANSVGGCLNYLIV